MATFVSELEAPLYGELWHDEDGGVWRLIEKSFPRYNRMLCLMENRDGYSEYFVFPYNY
jgi:hypothetical protein